MSGRGGRDPWLRANELLDARRDPRADAELARGLELDPAAQAELERLTRRLARLERPPRVLTTPRLAAAALVLLAPLAALLALRSGEQAAPLETLAGVEAAQAPAPRSTHVPSTAEAPPAALDPPRIPRVLDFRLVAESVRAGERHVTTATPAGVEHRQESVHGTGHTTVVVWSRR